MALEDTMKTLRPIAYALASITLLACGGGTSESSSTGTTAGSSTSAGSGGGGGSGAGGGMSTGAGGAGGEALMLPAAPLLEMVMPMASVLHVEWSTPEPCDEIEAERKDPAHDYAVAFAVAGTKINHMDGEAFEDMEYTYRLRCKVGTLYSGYSNEKSANPTKKQ
jgi:hypothetical protein